MTLAIILLLLMGGLLVCREPRSSSSGKSPALEETGNRRGNSAYVLGGFAEPGLRSDRSHRSADLKARAKALLNLRPGEIGIFALPLGSASEGDTSNDLVHNYVTDLATAFDAENALDHLQSALGQSPNGQPIGKAINADGSAGLELGDFKISVSTPGETSSEGPDEVHLDVGYPDDSHMSSLQSIRCHMEPGTVLVFRTRGKKGMDFMVARGPRE